MDQLPFLRVYAPEPGKERGSFSLYAPAAPRQESREDHYCEYRFAYEVDPPKEGLPFGKGPNDPANRDFYRIRSAYVVRREGGEFRPLFRALQQGEIGLAFRETGAGDFVGGYHGDERLTRAELWVDGRLLEPGEDYFGTVREFRFLEESVINRCNTPGVALAEHSQEYTLRGNTLLLQQQVRWLTEPLPLQSAFMPMLTAQRLDPEAPERILTDTVELYAPDGTLAASFDTTPYGAVGNPNAKGDDTLALGKHTFATHARVYGRSSGLRIEGGYESPDGSVAPEGIDTWLCVRFMPHTLDNKVYFGISKGMVPRAGEVWRSRVYYRITYGPEGE